MNYSLISPIQTINTLEQIFINRGFKKEDIWHYLNTTDNDIINPLEIDNIQQAAKLLLTHIKNNDKIFIQVDSDCDGYTSAATLINYLYRLFPSCISNITYRIHNGKEHGIIIEAIPEDVKLVIIPDAGSNDYEQHKFLKDKGIDVLVIDHHEAPYVSSDAVVVNNQLCGYPNKTLSGVGMVYKVCSYIDTLLITNQNIADDFLDLVATGMLADMMPLNQFETHHLIKKGLANIKNPFLYEMIERNRYSIGDEITPIGIAFYVAPYINAMVRAGTIQEKQLMFDAMLEVNKDIYVPSTKRGAKDGDLESIAAQGARTCANVKSRQTKIRDENVAAIENLIEQNNLGTNKVLFVQVPNNVSTDKRLTGLIANQLMAKYHRPTILVSEEIESDGTATYSGSARGYKDVVPFKDYIENTGLALYAVGHQGAFGVSFPKDKCEKFTKQSNEDFKNLDFQPNYKVDFIKTQKDITQDLIINIADLKELWGQGLEEPLIAITDIKVDKKNITLMSPDKNPTIKITLPNGIEIIKFKSSKEEFDSFNTSGYLLLNVVGKCGKNVWNEKTTAQFIVEDWEIAKEIKYYF